MKNNEPVPISIGSNEVQNVLKIRDVFLENLITQKKESLKEAPQGSLRISKCRNKIQYYQYGGDTEENNGKRKVYLPQSRNDHIRRLAQKQYDEKVLREAEKERQLLQSLLNHYKGNTVDTIFEQLSEGRKQIVEPIEESQEEFVRKWNAFTYTGKGFSADAPELFTDRGERVRSKSELIIANILFKKNIPYRYECPVRLKGYGTVYPDFTVLNVKQRKEYYWEHMGMMDDPVYLDHALQKVQSYISAGIYPGERLIVTAETRQRPVNVRIVEQMINKYCCSSSLFASDAGIYGKIIQ